MMLSALDALLLYALGIPLVMKYRILPIAGTPYWLFGTLFLIATFHIVVSLYPAVLGGWKKYHEAVKNFCLIATLFITIGLVSVTAMVDRAHVAPVYGVHDIILQQEAAMRYLIVGKNPYKETYFGTPVASFNYDEPGNTEAVNPALFHFVMPPWYLVFPFAFYYSVRPAVGFFDGRMALLFTFVLLLVAVWAWFRDKKIARIAVTLTALSPAVVDYFMEGRSDIFALSWLLAAFVLLEKRRVFLSAVLFGLALMSKQTTWFSVPFYLLYLWKVSATNPKKFVFPLLGMALVVMGLSVPFIVWDYKAFFDSVVFYLSGNSAHSYPVSGYGLGMILHDAGIIRDIHAYYPFIIWQAIVGLPLLIFLLRWLWGRSRQSVLMISYALFLSVIWYLSRYFNNSHLGYLSMLFVLGGLKGADEANT